MNRKGCPQFSAWSWGAIEKIEDEGDDEDKDEDEEDGEDEKELGRLGWREADLASRWKGDASKLEIALRLRQETTVSVRQIAARLHLGHAGQRQRLPAGGHEEKAPSRRHAWTLGDLTGSCKLQGRGLPPFLGNCSWRSAHLNRNNCELMTNLWCDPGFRRFRN